MHTSLLEHVFIELGDSRVYNWPLMANPWIVLGIIVLYLYLIYIYLPSYMADKKPYNLKWVIVIYNIFQIIACTLIVYGIATSGWTTDYKLIGCQPVDFSENKLALRMASMFWWTMILKIVELIETIFFMLRKNMIRGLLSFTPLINSVVHILMYTYYLLAAFGPEMQKSLERFKPKLTMIQLIQLLILTIQNMQVFLPGCNMNRITAYIFVPINVVNVMFFYKFYAQKYTKRRNVTLIEKKN